MWIALLFFFFISNSLNVTYLVQIDLAIRAARCSTVLFGGVQMILVLDPRQLPPVADKLYGDDGKFCFESALWKETINHIVKNFLQIIYTFYYKS